MLVVRRVNGKGSANSTNSSCLCVALNRILNGLRDSIPSGEIIQQFEIYYSRAV